MDWCIGESCGRWIGGLGASGRWTGEPVGPVGPVDGGPVGPVDGGPVDGGPVAPVDRWDRWTVDRWHRWTGGPVGR